MRTFSDKRITCRKVQCDAAYINKYQLRLARVAEVNGDHVCTIDFSTTGPVIAWSYLVGTTEHPISGRTSFLFTSANETYEIRASVRSGLDLGKEWDTTPLPYTVDASYAPEWANGKGNIIPHISNSVTGCYTVTVLRRRRPICPLPSPCDDVERKAVAYISTPSSNVCLNAITSINLIGHTMTIVDDNCVRDKAVAYSLTKYTLPKVLCGATHAAGTAITSDNFFAVPVDDRFVPTDLEINGEQCGGSFGIVDTGYDSIGVTEGSCYRLEPNYDDIYVPETPATIGGDVIHYMPDGARAVSGGGPVSEDEYSDPTVVSHWYTPTQTSRQYLAQEINATFTMSDTRTIEGCTSTLSVTVTVLKACGSGAIEVRKILARRHAWSGTIVWGVTGYDESSYIAHTIPIPGLGGGSEIRFTNSGTAGMGPFAGSWAYSHSFTAAFAIYLAP